MKKEEIQALFEVYEQAACEVNGIECWSARDLQKLLGYSLWQNFTKVISKAKEACENVGQPIMDHFIDVNKMIVADKGAQREVDDFMFEVTRDELSRCQNGISSWGGNRYNVFAFTELGVALVSVTLGIGMRKVQLPELDKAYSIAFPNSTPLNVNKKKRK